MVKDARESPESEQELVLTSLERDQLTGIKQRHCPRRELKGYEAAVVWSLRIYLIFMMGVVIYQIWTGAH